MKVARKSNIELLRIIAMLLIVAVHYYTVGILRTDSFTDNFNLNGILAQTISLGGRLGNELFILITGYFCIQSKFRVEKIVKIINATHFYSWIILFFALLINEQVDIMKILFSLFPILFSSYWFVTAFLGVMLLSPFLNILMSKLQIKDQIYLISVMTFFTSVLPTITKEMKSTVSIDNLWLFVTLYLIGGFIRKNSSFLNKIDKSKLILATVFFNAMMLASVYLFDVMSFYFNDKNLLEDAWFFNRQESFLLMLCSVSFFMVFTRIDIGSIGWINKLSTATFGVYLIHGNMFIHENLYTRILNVERFYYLSPILFLVVTIFEVMLIFVLCSGIELIRLKLFSWLNFDSLITNSMDWIKKKLNSNAVSLLVKKRL